MDTAADRTNAFFASQSARVRGRFLDASGRLQPAAAEIDRYAHRQGEKFRLRVHRAQQQAIYFSDEGVSRFALELLDRLAPAVAAAFREEVIPLAEHAIEEWPVDSGRSRDGLALAFDYKDGVASALFYGAAAYTWFVKYALESAVRAQVRQAALSGETSVTVNGETLAIGDKRITQLKSAEEFRKRVRGRLQQLGAGDDDDALGPTFARVGAEFKISPAYVRAIWRQTHTTAPRTYRAPDGSNPRGKQAWSVQVINPARSIESGMADIVTRELAAK